MQARRAITLAERSLISASADRCLWFGKNACNPDLLVKLVIISRSYPNDCEVCEDGKTPAVRLGLARGRIGAENIVCFTPRAACDPLRILEAVLFDR